MMRELILDTETTGFSPQQGHRVIELACIELMNRIPTGRTWRWYFNPERAVDAGATKVHGITTAFLKDKPLFRSLIREIADVLADAHIVAHNAAFDVDFLNHEFRLAGADLRIEAQRVTCTLDLARRKWPGSPASLDALCKRYRIDNTKRSLHGALLDCELLAQVYVELIGGRQATLDLITHESDSTAQAGVLIRLKPLKPRLTEAEAEAHAAMVAELGSGAVWLRVSA